MKKLLCVALTLIMVVMTAAFSVPASAADNGTLTVTVNGANPVEVPVGDEFLLFVGLYAGDTKILDGQVHMEYDSDYVSFVPQTAIYMADDDEPEVEKYCFPYSIYSSSIVMNYATPDIINYNFTKAQGVAVFNDATKRFARFRFKAETAGTTDISHVIQYMVDVNENRIYYQSKAHGSINPYTICTVEPADGCFGDADGDYAVTILDATFAQRVAAGETLSYNAQYADVSGDKFLSLRDAMIIRKYLAGEAVDSSVGNYFYASGKA